MIGSQTSSTSSLSGPTKPSARCAMAAISAAKKRLSKRRGRFGGVMARRDEMDGAEVGNDAGFGERLPRPRRRRDRRRTRRAEHEAGLLIGLADRGEREARGFRRAGMSDFCHQAGDVAVVQSGERRHLPVRRLDAAAGKNEFSRHETVPLVAAAEQHFRHGLGAVDEDQRRGIPRFQVRKSLIADGLGQPLDPVGGDAALDRWVSTRVTHYTSISLLALAAMFSASALAVAELRPGRRLMSSLLLRPRRHGARA